MHTRGRLGEKHGERGWLLGHFGRGPLHERHCEIKYGKHPKGERKITPAFNKKARTWTTVIKGEMRITLRKGTRQAQLVLHAGDWILVEPNVCHQSYFPKTTIALAVRWPSRKGDQVACRHQGHTFK